MAKTALMRIWNVELGLAVHVKAPNGKYIVIDLGSTNNVSPLLSLRGKDVGFMVITHPHLDHFSDIGNINFARPQVLWRSHSFTRQELLRGIRPSDITKVTQYCDFVESYNGTLTEQEKPSSGSPFDGLTAQVFSDSSCDKTNKNNFSGIVVLSMGPAKIIVCGDNEKESFDKLMKKADFQSAVKDAWVLVASHHGRESGYHENFVSLVNPYLTVISDTNKVTTTAVNNYSRKSRGFEVYDSLAWKWVQRHCLTTRSDGNIEITFGENDDMQNRGLLHVETHK